MFSGFKSALIGFILLAITPCFVHSESRIDMLLGSQTSKKYEHVRVEKVIRGDTIILESGEKIRLIGIEASDPPRAKNIPTDPYGFPIKQEVDPTTPIAEQSYEFVRGLLEDHYVRLESDVQKTGEQSETLAYVFLDDGTFVNEEILKQGFANLKIIPPNTKYIEKFQNAYQEARREKRGLQNE